MEVKQIIFDLGGVLLNLDYQKTANLLSALGFGAVFSKKQQIALVDDFEEGKNTSEEFITKMYALIGKSEIKKLDQLTFLHAWNAILLDFPPERVALLKELKKRMPIYLYSNTNAIHVTHFEKNFTDQYQIPLKSLFHQAYYSHELGIRKPKTIGFARILHNHQLNPAETLFIDDSPQHITGALKAGLQAIHLDLAKQDIHGLLKELNLR